MHVNSRVRNCVDRSAILSAGSSRLIRSPDGISPLSPRIRPNQNNLNFQPDDMDGDSRMSKARTEYTLTNGSEKLPQFSLTEIHEAIRSCETEAEIIESGQVSCDWQCFRSYTLNSGLRSTFI